jgi:alkylresorcinol/alkylpyrone synthase
MTTPTPRLLSLATSVPPHRLGQPEVAERARRLFADTAGADIDRLLPVFARAGIEQRFSCVPIDWYEDAHGWVDRNAIYVESAVSLLEEAALAALDRAGLGPDEIDSVVTVSTTGIATPSLDAILAGQLGLRSDIRRLPIFGLGCAGGVIGLARAAELARAAPKSRVLLLVVELCALCFRRDDASKSNVVATALFGDGAAAAIVSCQGQGDGTRPAIGAAGEHLFPDSLDVMGWQVAEDGLKALFSRDIPTLVRAEMGGLVRQFLAAHGMTIGDIGHFVCHPGGAKVIAALEETFALETGALDGARGVLRDYGNMSAASVLFVLERTLASGAAGKMLMTSLGPGFTAAYLLLDTPAAA